LLSQKENVLLGCFVRSFRERVVQFRVAGASEMDGNIVNYGLVGIGRIKFHVDMPHNVIVVSSKLLLLLW